MPGTTTTPRTATALPIVSGWIATSTTDTEHAVLYLAAPPTEPEMAHDLAERLGLLYGDDRIMQCWPNTRLVFNGPYARLLLADGTWFETMVSREWRGIAETARRILVALSWMPCEIGEDLRAQSAAAYATGQVTIGWCPAG